MAEMDFHWSNWACSLLKIPRNCLLDLRFTCELAPVELVLRIGMYVETVDYHRHHALFIKNIQGNGLNTKASILL